MVDIDMTEIGKRIKELRSELGLSQAQLAEKIGVAQNTVAQYESGKSKISIDVLVNLAKVFEISTDYILCIKND